MNHYLNAKISSISDAILGLVGALMQVKPPTEGQRVQIVKHVHEGRLLVELRVVRDHDKATSDYGVRQAWIYTYPEEARFELHYTTRDDILKIVESYPHLKTNASVVFTTQQKAASTFTLENIYPACDILHLYLTDPSDTLPGIGGNVETNLPQQDA
jgi:hypothetical protein